MNITSMSPSTGRMMKENGTTVNIADLLSKGSAAVSSGKFNIDSFSPRTGRMIREDGTVVNIAELIEQFVNSGGGSVTPEQIQEAVNNYLTQNPVQIKQANETTLGGIKAKQKTTETVEAAIDPETGKIYVPTYPESGGGSSGYVPPNKVSHGTADTTFTLPPNVEHAWDEVAELNLTLQEGEEGKSNIHCVSFISGATPTHLEFSPKATLTKDIEPNGKYTIVILNGIAAVGRGEL